MKNALPTGSKGTINVKLFESYTKMHHKGNHISLERALRAQKYFEIDVDIHTWSSATLNGFNAVKARMQSMLIRGGAVIQRRRPPAEAPSG